MGNFRISTTTGVSITVIAIIILGVCGTCFAFAVLSAANSSQPTSYVIRATLPPLDITRSGDASKDLGQQSVSFGSINQAKELLNLINEQPGKVDYQVSYSTDEGAVLFGCNFEKDVIVRIHQDNDGGGTTESWSGYIMDRLQATADGTGSLNDTPEGKIFAENTHTPGHTPTPIIYKFNGNGDDYVMFTSPGSGLAQFSIAHRGDSNFAVELHTADGDYIELLVNEIGDYNGRTTQRVGPGQYVLDITADGGWAVTVAPPQ